LRDALPDRFPVGARRFKGRIVAQDFTKNRIERENVGLRVLGKDGGIFPKEVCREH
jgi:hypothetical protein